MSEWKKWSACDWKPESFYMTTQPDFEELLRLFAVHKVEYMIVGGFAVAHHGHPRFTKDIDLYYEHSPENISRIRHALADFGFPDGVLTDDLFERGKVVVFGSEPVRIDLLNEISGVPYDKARPNKVGGEYGAVCVSYISRTDLLLNKRASGRAQDLADAEKLAGDSE